MNYDLIIARYGEIGLKSPKIRSRFERKLVENIKATFECDVQRNQGRIYINPMDFEDGVEKLNNVLRENSIKKLLIVMTRWHYSSLRKVRQKSDECSI